MAMSGTSLGTEIKNALEGAGFLISSSDPNVDPEAIWQEIADAIVAHIQTNAIVNIGIAVQVSTSTGTGATTGPGTIS